MDKTFVIFVSPLLMREKLTRKVVLCTGIVLFGMLLMNLKNLNAGGDHFGLFCGAMTCLILLGAYMMVTRAPQGTKSSSPAIPHQQSSRIAS